MHADSVEGVTYTITLDFDAARSVVKQGNGSYSLKPVIRALSEATSGAIKGAITPFESQPAVFAIIGSDTVATAYTDEFGKFLIRGFQPVHIQSVLFQRKDLIHFKRRMSLSQLAMSQMLVL